MSLLGRIFARLFGGRAAALRPQPPAPAPEDAPAMEPTAAIADHVIQEPRSELAFTSALGAASGEAQVLAAQAGVAIVGEDAPTADDEDVFEEEERADDAADDPGHDLDDKIAARAAAVPYLRQVAEEEALAGEHRVRPTDPSGPGTLAEALSRLEAAGRLTCELGEDEAGAPILVYRPIPSPH